ncbi:MAG: hypothetical protein WC508_05695 [Patescibacteria group bacterium]
MRYSDNVEGGTSYLLSQVTDGLCPEFHEFSHGFSQAWTASCAGSTFAEFGAVPPEMLDAIMSLRHKCGGWSYNQKVSPDADTTLRVLQFISKIGFSNQAIITAAQKFVIAHQQPDGGIATYLPTMLTAMGYPTGGWTISHPCVTALAINILPDCLARKKAWRYLTNRLVTGNAQAYWWRTPWYVRAEIGWIGNDYVRTDSVEISLALILKAKLKMTDRNLLARLLRLQLDDGSFPSSQMFRVPRPHQLLGDITEETKIMPDRRRVLSTAAATVAISRQEALSN